MGVEPSNVLCGFKEGFVNAIINDRTGGMGSVEEVECCAAGGKDCRFKVKTIHHEPRSEIPLPVLG
jgi:predicted hydrocarbon binding protein